MEKDSAFAPRIYQVMRVHTMSEIYFSYVSDPPVPFEQLDAILDPLLDRLYEAKSRLIGFG